MADQKKKPTRKSPARRKSAKVAATEAVQVAAAGSPRSASAPRTGARRPKAPLAGAASLFDAHFPKEVRDAIEAAETKPRAAGAPIARALSDTAAASTAHVIEASAAQSRESVDRARIAGGDLRLVVAETAQATTLGAMEVNGKVLDALRAQSDVALDLWRAALKTNSVSDAIALQASGTRQAYEIAARNWTDVAESARRWFGATVKPFQTAWIRQAR